MSSTTRRRLALAGVPALAVLASALWLAMAASSLPDPVATHFGGDGNADGFTSLAGAIPLFVGMQLVLWALLGALVAGQGPQVTGGRGLLGLPAGVVGVIATLSVVTLVPQRGLTDAADATLTPAAVLVALAGGLALWGLAGLVAPPAPAAEATTAAPPPDRPRADVDGTAIWQGRTPTGRALPITAALLGIVAAVLWWFAGALAGIVTVLPVVALVASTRFDVTIGPGGLVVRGVLGFPRTHVPLQVIRDADVEEVAPFRQYGGWGWRVRKDRTAIVTVRGLGLLVTRTDGAQLIVSLDEEAARAAGILNQLLDRRGAGRAADPPA